MAYTYPLSPNLTLTLKSLNKYLNSSRPLHSGPCCWRNKRNCTMIASAASSCLPINVDYFEREFSGHGVSFAGIGDSCVIKMELDNGSKTSLMLPSGLITSYKAQMWHGGTLEVLRTSVSEGENGGAVVQGGISVHFECVSDGGLSWSPNTWTLHDVRGSSQNSIQVELESSDAEDTVSVMHTVTLRSDALTSELVFSNLKSLPLNLMGSVVSHLAVSTPDATYAAGLQGSNYLRMPPLMSNFSIIPSDFDLKKTLKPHQSRSQMALREILSSWGIKDQESTAKSEDTGNETEEMEGEENDDYKQLTEKMGRIYTNASRRLTIIDRGRRNSVVLGRDGFEELYMFSPGSNYEWYSKYAYICAGPSAMLKPIILGPNNVWMAGQYLHNPNL